MPLYIIKYIFLVGLITSERNIKLAVLLLNKPQHYSKLWVFLWIYLCDFTNCYCIYYITRSFQLSNPWLWLSIKNCAGSENNQFIESARFVCVRYEVCILIASLVYQGDRSNKRFNRSVIITLKDSIDTVFYKVHMFDDGLGQLVVFAASYHYKPGDSQKFVLDYLLKIGMIIWYGHRFMAFSSYRNNLLTVPSAFTKVTRENIGEFFCELRKLGVVLMLLQHLNIGFIQAQQENHMIIHILFPQLVRF